MFISNTLGLRVLTPKVLRFVIGYARVTNPHLKIIASAGTEEKLAVLKEAGADIVFNYKPTETVQALKEHGPVDR